MDDKVQKSATLYELIAACNVNVNIQKLPKIFPDS